MKGGDINNVVYIENLAEQLHWSNYITGIRWTTNFDDKTEYKITKAKTFTDTGASCISGPKAEMDKISNTIYNLITA